ncbi:unnamed protein product [Cutaneotrichosporon oleaginosum]
MSNYGQPVGGPPHQLGMPPNDANRGYDADHQPPSAVPAGDGANGAPAQGPPPPPPTKGKNGATGPAEGKPKPHVCPICQRGFTTGGHLQRHQRIHTGIKAFKCPYPGCETRTSRQDNLQQHYRTHLSPTLRRGSGTAARQAVAAAMMAAGLKSSNSRQPRKSKGSNAGTPSSSAGSSVTHGQSPYQTPTQASAPYGGYMHDPNQYGYPSGYPLPPPGVVPGAAAQSAQSSRVASPVNGHSAASSMPAAHHQQFYSQPFSPAYAAYPGASQYGQGYRYAPGTMPSPYGAHSQYYSQGVAPDHTQQHMYPGMQNGAVPYSRESGSYSMMTAGGYATQPQMSNGYPPRTQSSTPGDDLDPRYRGNGAAPREPSPSSVSRRRLTTSQANNVSAGVVDPSSVSSAQSASAGVPSYAYSNGGGYGYGHSVPSRASATTADVKGHNN